MDKNPLAHDPRDRVLERSAVIGTVRLAAKPWSKNREIPSGLNYIADAPIQQYVRQIRDCTERGR